MYFGVRPVSLIAPLCCPAPSHLPVDVQSGGWGGGEPGERCEQAPEEGGRRRAKRSEDPGGSRGSVRSSEPELLCRTRSRPRAAAAALYRPLRSPHSVSLGLPLIGFNERFNNIALPDQIRLLLSARLNPGSPLCDASVSPGSPLG